METNLKQVAEAVLAAVSNEEAFPGDVDGVDTVVETCGVPGAPPGSEPAYQFTMMKWHEIPRPKNHRGLGGGTPLGQTIYTVTVTAKYTPFDEE